MNSPHQPNTPIPTVAELTLRIRDQINKTFDNPSIAIKIAEIKSYLLSVIDNTEMDHTNITAITDTTHTNFSKAVWILVQKELQNLKKQNQSTNQTQSLLRNTYIDLNMWQVLEALEEAKTNGSSMYSFDNQFFKIERGKNQWKIFYQKIDGSTDSFFHNMTDPAWAFVEIQNNAQKKYPEKHDANFWDTITEEKLDTFLQKIPKTLQKKWSYIYKWKPYTVQYNDTWYEYTIKYPENDMTEEFTSDGINEDENRNNVLVKVLWAVESPITCDIWVDWDRQKMITLVEDIGNSRKKIGSYEYGWKTYTIKLIGNNYTAEYPYKSMFSVKKSTKPLSKKDVIKSLEDTIKALSEKEKAKTKKQDKVAEKVRKKWEKSQKPVTERPEKKQSLDEPKKPSKIKKVLKYATLGGGAILWGTTLLSLWSWIGVSTIWAGAISIVGASIIPILWLTWIVYGGVKLYKYYNNKK